MQVDGIFVLHRGVEIRVTSGGQLTLGSGYLADDVRIDCQQQVSIGKRVAIAARTVIMDTDHHELTGARARTAPVVIGDDVWIGMGATILKGVTIGSGAVVAAGSIVIRDVPPGMLVAGSPAREIRPVTWSI
ncbi:acyltransferase [Nostoc sp. 3335mG]|nr:acyltransferase [Nostoc sp. 3335mG]